jgi:hypothetical protein
MPRYQNEISLVGSTNIAVGLSVIVKLMPSAYLYATNIKIKSGGGTLEIVPQPLALSGASTIGWGLGYPIGSNESIQIDGPSVSYLAATGATMIISVLIGFSNGASVTT